MDKRIVIGISGVARCGKDTFFKQLRSIVPDCERFALADELKRETRAAIMEETSVDILNCSKEEKESARHLLVCYAKSKRMDTNGRHWIEKLAPSIEASVSSMICVTDVRHGDYPRDEIYWIKNEMKGFLVHISQFKYVDCDAGKLKVFLQPANEEERRNEPVLKAAADYRIEWEYTPDSQQELMKHIIGFVDWLYEATGRKFSRDGEGQKV